LLVERAEKGQQVAYWRYLPSPAATPAVAGIQLGWEHLLNKLARELVPGSSY
jgi:hypothetical protein